MNRNLQLGLLVTGLLGGTFFGASHFLDADDASTAQRDDARPLPLVAVEDAPPEASPSEAASVEAAVPAGETEPARAADSASEDLFDLDSDDGTDDEDEDDLDLPRATPACDFAEVTLIIASDDQAHTFASIADKGGDRKMFYVGDAVSDHTIVDIQWDRVWFDGSGGLCQARVGDKLPRSRATKRSAPKKKRKKGKKGPPKVPDHIKDRISQVGPNRYKIDRAAFDEVFEMSNGLVRGTKLKRMKEGDKTVGIRLKGRGVAEGSLLHTIGIRSGDVLKSVNGFSPTDPQKALEAYGRLKMANDVTLVLERDGKPLQIEYQIQ